MKDRSDVQLLNNFQPQCNELTRGPPELTSSALSSSHRSKSPIFYMVWQYRSPIPVGRKGVISSFK